MNDSYFWSLESWGAQEPPENAKEIIESANNRILMEIASGRVTSEESAKDFSETLWEAFCRGEENVFLY